MSLIADYLPDDANTPVLFKFGTDDIPIMILSVQAQESMKSLYKILDDRVASPLSRIKGVGTVSISGAPEREIQVYCDPYKLEAYNLTVEGIAATKAYENRNTPGGNLTLARNPDNTQCMENQGSPQIENIHWVIQGRKLSERCAVWKTPSRKDPGDLIEEYREEYRNSEAGGSNTVQICQKVLKGSGIEKNSIHIKIGVVTAFRQHHRIINSLIETILIP